MAAAVSTAVEQGDTPLQLDVGLLASFDYNPISARTFKKDPEGVLQARARNATQHLVNTIFQLPIERHATYGPLASLPAFETELPREKPVPKPKPLTKWEKFAKAKGITKRKKDKMIFDEERQEWVPRWGYQGANKKLEDQWLVEVPTNADDDYRPDREAAKERKARQAKNEAQHQRNLARNAAAPAAPKSELGSGVAPSRARRRAELEADLLRARGSTASLGRFDKSLEGESKPRGVKRTFQPNEIDAGKERAAHLELLAKMGKGEPQMNLRKAIKYASKAQGSKALAEKAARRRK
ncbi:Rhodanese- sulfurtransferase [Malassezia caprae]|uniref:Ribosome biogenesis regulatory protein n=1 Tax=Malassezia caprae TaxID=1381934 RepID=A0AAF0ITM4_9BASI|nr:Rhodanese- sulfurtransferase [Malassezia caprae]